MGPAGVAPVAAHGLMFHRFRSADDAPHWQGALSATTFEAMLRSVGTDRILDPEEWMARVDAGRLGAGDLCVTFDDGLRCQYDVARPVLESLGLRAFFFVYTCPRDRRPFKGEVYAWAAGRMGGMSVLIQEFFAQAPQAMHEALETPAYAAYAARLRPVAPFYSEDDLRFRFVRNQPHLRESFDDVMDTLLTARGFDAAALIDALWMDDASLRALADAGHLVGLHSHDHPYAMADLSAADQYDQYATNARHLTEATGRTPVCMSHPLNSYNADTLEVLAGLHIRCGFRANLAVPPGGAGALELPREDAANLLSLTFDKDPR